MNARKWLSGWVAVYRNERVERASGMTDDDEWLIWEHPMQQSDLPVTEQRLSRLIKSHLSAGRVHLAGVTAGTHVRDTTVF